jgi:hypothetical protein
MKHRDRVLTALEHGIPDRCPMQISYTPEFAARLEKAMNLGPTHSVQLETPMENFRAMVEAITQRPYPTGCRA